MSNLGPHRKSSKREHCPICDKPDGCLMFEDGWVACRVVESDRMTESGWFLHWNGAGDQPGHDWRNQAPRYEAPRPPDPVVNEELSSRAYQALLARCPLNDEHRAGLRRRGMSDAEIDHDGYGSLPEEGRSDLAAAVIADVGVEKMGAVPGFYTLNDSPSFRALPGLLIPVRDALGRVRRLRLSPDDPVKRAEGKYRWVSSSDLPDGIGSGVRAHVALPVTPTTTYHRIGLTEGEFKASIAARKTGLPFLSMPGVGAISALKKAIPGLRKWGVREIIMAFDTDAATNPQVASGLNRASDLLEAEGFVVLHATWPVEFKGIDDALVSGMIPMIEREIAKADRSADDMGTAELRRKYKDLSEMHSAVMQTLRNSALNPTERIVAICLMKNIDWAASKDGDSAPFHIPAARIADDAGVSQSTAAAAIKTLETGLVLPNRSDDAEAESEPVRLFDKTVKFSRNVTHKGTGEIRDIKQAFFTPRVENMRAGLSLLARAEKITPRAHGGKRMIVCPDHPDANIVVRRQFHCGECDRLLDRDEKVISPRAAVADADLPGVNEQDAGLVENATREDVKRTVKSSAFHKYTIVNDDLGFGRTPVAANWTPPPRAPDPVIDRGEVVF